MSLVVRQIATYKELTTHWDINEVYAMHEILDIQDDLEAQEIEQMKLRSKQR